MMPTYKPVGIDENSNFPTRVLNRLLTLFSSGGESHILRNPAGSIAANMSLRSSTMANQSVLTSGRSRASIVGLTKRSVVTGLAFITGTTAAASPTNWWVALTDATGKVVAVSANQLTAAIAASTQYKIPFATALTLPPGQYYAVLMVAATTPPTLYGVTGVFSAVTIAPVTDGDSATTGSTTPPAVGDTLVLPTTQSGTVPFFYLY